MNGIEVRLRDIDERPDPEIARNFVAGLKGELPALWKTIKVTVAPGRVKREGDVEWRYQRENAERAVRRIRGVTGVSNLIGLRFTATTIDVKRRIGLALLRSAEIDVNRIKVEANGGKVVLSAIVRL